MGDNFDSNTPLDVDYSGCEENLTSHSPEECKLEIRNLNDNDVFPVPQVGMVFSSEDEVRLYYAKFANRQGFRFKTRTSKKGDDGKINYFILACSRAGIRRGNRGMRNTSDSSRKENCKAKITVTLCEDGTFRILTVVLSHNHELFLHQALKDIHIRRRRISDLKDTEVSVKRTSEFNDCGNDLQKERHLIGRGGDSEALQNYLMRMQEKDSKFFYAIDWDDFFRVRNVFWADGRSRATYESFGDVVTVDTTYLSDRYKVPLATFVGVNHHGQSVLFGCGLLSCEDSESFTWLFQSWLRCMSGVPPQGIITDQCEAVQKAIEAVFPSTRHRWCLSCVMKKLPHKLHGYDKYKSIRDHLQNVVYDTLTTNEFERNWKKIMEDFSLEDNKWLKELFLQRHRWVPLFVKGDFWAGMSINQRSESMHAFFDGYANHHTTLKQFVDHYDIALQDKVEKEFVADIHSSSSTQACVTKSPFERQFQSAYTHAKFLEVQDEFVGKADCNVSVASSNSSTRHYNVIEDVMIGNEPKETMVEVTFDRASCDVKCNCCLFEFKGILCRHSLAILSQERVKEVPCKYILDRWRKSVKRNYVYIKTSYGVQHLKPHIQRLELLCNQFNSVADFAAEFEETSSLVEATLCTLKEKLEAWASHLRKSSKVNGEEAQVTLC
ncbi:PREDICTED: protein FAR1-RELATED SEQUENCE 4-like [Lupinus angustifolius]|nr:PREDICTED: protein FAR1-RELATED SEQUENCE 4-like [Lupinus angustifolius]